MIEKYWNQRIDELAKYVKTQKEKLKAEAPDELNHLRNNLFVEGGLSEVVEANITDVMNSLNSLELTIEKIRHYYVNL